METLDKIRKLLDKHKGVGITRATLGKYCGYCPNSVNYYLYNNVEITPEVAEIYERGMAKMLEDIRSIIEDND